MRAVIARCAMLVLGPVLGVGFRLFVPMLPLYTCLVLCCSESRFVMYSPVTKLADRRFHVGRAVTEEDQGRSKGTKTHGSK